ncbi:MAG: CPBP family glutamic-type intramembrane protease [Candidatus Wallbacteria bacterium]|nr:CPBP family glutamic-type intramembrane protease [Candidatus Wallbacteria bacterium]
MASLSILKTYWQESKRLSYSFLMALPLLLVYEFETLKLNNSDIEGFRNLADLVIKQMFAFFGIKGHLAVAFMLCLILLLVYRKEKDQQIRPGFFIFMILESFVYAVLLAPAIEKLHHYLALSQRVQFASCLGAGIYEEFLFRVVFFSGIFCLLCKVIKQPWLVFVLSLMSSSAAFAGFHYFGSYGEPFALGSFIYRLLAGVLLCLLYYFRGFGIASYTHTIYNLLVLYNIDLWKIWLK